MFKFDSPQSFQEPLEEKGVLSDVDKKYEEIKRLKGEEAAKTLMEDILKGDKDLAENRLRNIPDLEIVLEKAWDKLQEMNFFDVNEDGRKIFDVGKMKDELTGNVLKKLGAIFEGKYFGNRNISKTLHLLFNNVKGISKEDYENGIREEKDLIYFPKSERDALDIEKIKKSDFYLSLYDLIGKVGSYDKTRYGNLESLDYREVVLPLLIYHPHYGNGYRDSKDGKVYVFDKKANDFVLLTSEFIQKNWGVFGPHGRGDNFAQPQLFVKKHLSHLVEKGILIPEDFTTRRDIRNRNSADRAILKIKSKGQIWFNGMEYSTGIESAKSGNKAYQLSKKLGGITDESGELKTIFNLFEKNEKFSRTPGNSPKKYYQVRKNETNPREFKKEEFFSRLSNESDEDYTKRLNEIADFKDVLEASDKLITQENLNLVELDFKNQLLAATLYKKIGEEKFMNFIHEYRTDGLRACLALENGNEMEKVISQITKQKEKDPKFSARLVFRKFNQIIQEKENLQDIVSQMVLDREFGEKDYADMLDNFEKRSQKILKDFLGRINELSVDEVESGLGTIQRQMIFLGSILTLFKERKGEFSLEDIKGLEIQEAGKKELDENPELWEKLQTMYRTNNSHKSKEDLERLMRDFEEHRKHDPRFHLVYFDKSASSAETSPEKSLDNLVGFMRSSNFDGQKELKDGERYLGAMNINPLLQKFYFGENFLREITEKELASGAKKLIAHVPENGPSHKITKVLGFQDMAQEGEYKDDGGKVIARRIRVELTKE